ncbi:RNA polymerase II transcription mediator complex subunit 9-domain-containing protein [Aspergillus crustosus]
MASRSPTAATPGPKSSAPDSPVINDAPTTQQAVSFPSPQTFDFIPPLHGLILRLLSSQSTVAGHINGENEVASGQAQSQQQQSSSALGNESNSADLLAAVSSSAPAPTSAAADIAALGSNMPPPLDIKNLPTEVSSIKIRIQKAQAVIESLPDVHRTVTDQEKEIRQLEDRIMKLKSVISDFGRRANNAGSDKANAPGP